MFSARSVTLLVVLLAGVARADDVLFEYTADVLPSEASAGFPEFRTCEDPTQCSEEIIDGHYVVQWIGTTSQLIGYLHRIPTPLTTLWCEWRFRSDTAVSPFGGGCNGHADVQFRETSDRISLEGDLVEGGGGGQVISGLPLDEFYTVRFESRDGLNYQWTVDGRVLLTHVGNGASVDLIRFGGNGCVSRPPFTVLRDEWDFVRYGTISDGELIASSDPPAGDVAINAYPDLDRFTVTFDTPGFVRVADITVSVADGSDPPVVLWIKRLDNDTADRAQIVLDRTLTVGTTTTFRLDTGGQPQTLSYTYLSFGACCFDDGTCEDGEESLCNSEGGAFTAGASCESTRGCCFDDGACLDLAPACCELAGGTSLTVEPLCEGDADSDNVDGLCGDNCPTDPSKTDPGECGCGMSDVDSDGDTVPDCNDQCDGQDDTRDFDNNNIPDCVEFFPIPTVSTWGLIVLTLLLAIGAKALSRRQPTPGR